MAQPMLTVRAELSLQVDEFTAWLNPKGNRELALRNILTKWWPHIVPGIRKRLSVRR
jgi:Williams-Beuren syndrome DDT (WSD), D-TOX E motif